MRDERSVFPTKSMPPRSVILPISDSWRMKMATAKDLAFAREWEHNSLLQAVAQAEPKVTDRKYSRFTSTFWTNTIKICARGMKIICRVDRTLKWADVTYKVRKFATNRKLKISGYRGYNESSFGRHIYLGKNICGGKAWLTEQRTSSTGKF